MKLTLSHIHLLRVFDQFEPGEWVTSYRVIAHSDFDLWSMGTVVGFLNSLTRHGYLISKKGVAGTRDLYFPAGTRITRWSLGPLSDELKEEGII